MRSHNQRKDDSAQRENTPPTPLATSRHCSHAVQLVEVHSRALQLKRCDRTYSQLEGVREGRIELLFGRRHAWKLTQRGRMGCVRGDGGNSGGEWIKSALIRRLELSGLVNAPKRISCVVGGEA